MPPTTGGIPPIWTEVKQLSQMGLLPTAAESAVLKGIGPVPQRVSTAPVGRASDWTLITLGAGITSSDAAVRENAGRYEFRGRLTGTLVTSMAVGSLPAALPLPAVSAVACASSTGGVVVVNIDALGNLTLGTVSGGPTWVQLDALTAPIAQAAVVDAAVAPTLPVVRLETLGQTIPDPTLDIYITGFITVESNGNSAIPDMARQAIDISGHGTSTWVLPKKPYKLRFPADAAFLGMPASRHWRALANGYDASSMRTSMSFELMRRIYGSWTPRYEFAELYIDGVYMGLFQMTESVRASSVRLPVNLASSSATSGLSSTGAFMLEINTRYVTEGEPGFNTAPSNVPIMFDDPSPPNASQITYLTNWINNFDAVLMGASWLDPVIGYAKYVDMQSFADWYLVSELTRNQDSTFFASCKLYKTRDTEYVPGKLFMGPLWDHDLSLGNGFNNTANAIRDWSGLHNIWWTRGAVWINRMMSDPAFQAVLLTEWNRLKDAIYGPVGVVENSRSAVIRLGAAGAADARRWGKNPDLRTRHELILNWLRRRIDWLNPRMTTPVAVNLMPYPRGSAGSAPNQWIAIAGTAAITTPAGNPIGGNAVRATWSVASTGSSSGLNVNNIPTTEGKTYTILVAVRTSVQKQMLLRAQFYNVSNGAVGSQVLPSGTPADPGVTVPANTLTYLPAIVAVCPAGAVKVTVNPFTYTSVGFAVGEWMEVCGIMVVEGAFPDLKYSDPGIDVRWTWDGTADASTSRGWPQ